MINTSPLEITEYYDIRGNVERTEYKWTGGPMIEISRPLLDRMNLGNKSVGEVIKFGPFKLRIVEEYYDRDTIAAVRMDYLFSRLIYFWHRYDRVFDLAYHRFIFTLAIWRLAEYNPAVISTWRDIYFIQKIRNKLYD